MASRDDEAAGRDPSPGDPYRTLGVPADVSDADLRRAYRRLALVHHPDHNAGSHLAGTRFAEIQSAYDAIMRLRRHHTAAMPELFQSDRTSGSPETRWTDPWLQSRIAAVERDYTAQRRSQLDDLAAQAPPYAPRRPQGSLRDRLTDWFRDG